MAAYPVVADGIWMKFKLIQHFIVFLVTCNYMKDPFKLKTLEGSEHFSINQCMVNFADAQGQSVVHGLIL